MRQVRSIQHLTWLLDNWALSLSPCCCLASLDTSLLCLHRAGPVSECGQPGPVSGQSGQPGLTDWRISRRLHSAPSLLSTCVCLPLYLTAAVPPRSDSAGARWWSHKRRRPGGMRGKLEVFDWHPSKFLQTFSWRWHCLLSEPPVTVNNVLRPECSAQCIRLGRGCPGRGDQWVVHQCQWRVCPELMQEAALC